MARIEEATLFRPDPKLQYPGGGGGGGQRGPSGGGGGGAEEDDGPQIAVRERIVEAARSANRRKGLSFVVTVLCGALTVLAAIFAPRRYEVESRVLVQRTQAITGQQQPVYVSPEEQRNIAREYEEQIMARDNILAIVRQRDLVNRWDAMRQPHRRLIDRVNGKLGRQPPADEQKFEALVNNVEHRMKVWVDATTVTVRLDWSEPESARDIVDAAMKNFLDARFQSEVGVIPERLKILQTAVSQAHKDLETAALELVRLLKQKDPAKKLRVYVPALPAGVKDRPEADFPADPVLQGKLDALRQQIGVAQEARTRRIAELNQQLTEQQQTLAPGHPTIIALKQTIAATKRDSSQLAALREREKKLQGDISAGRRAAAAKAAANRPAPRRPGRPSSAAPEPAPPPPVVMGAKSVQDAQVQFDAVTRKYTDLVTQLDTARIEMQTAEAAFKNRYKVTHPAEVPAGPKRPVGLIAIFIGILATIGAVLAVATLADRFSGLFFEPRDVRDRLGLPVFATFS